MRSRLGIKTKHGSGTDHEIQYKNKSCHVPLSIVQISKADISTCICIYYLSKYIFKISDRSVT